jgi:3-deoxy-D-manno-octulosonic-acid transferase
MQSSGDRRPRLADPLPMTLRVYRRLSSAMVPLAPALINRRLKLGKEDPARVGERRGVSADVRPVGPLVWIHGASVGEVLASAALVEQLRELNLRRRWLPSAFRLTSSINMCRTIRRVMSRGFSIIGGRRWRCSSKAICGRT